MASNKALTSPIKKNFIFNLINTVCGLLFPLITIPYVSRILLADGIGQIQFFRSIIDYIILITSLGIPLYAVREIARFRNDSQRMSKITIEIFLLHLLLCFIGYAIVFILISTTAKIQANIPLFLLLSIAIILTPIGVEWFYQGIEDFKYITIRSLIVKSVSLLALFLFVKEKNDLLYYAAISIIGTVGNNIFNFIRLKKHITLHPLKTGAICLSQHIRPTLKIFALNLIISLYIYLDSIMLGFLQNEIAVGYYTASIRISKVLVGVISSIGIVLIPHLSYLASHHKTEEFKSLSNKYTNFIIGISLPVITTLIFMASPIIHLFCGYYFEPSILTLQIMAPIVILIPLSSMYNLQILYALGKEKLSILSVSCGAICNFILNLCLIPLYSQYGAAISTLIAEFTIALSSVLLGNKYVSLRSFSKEKTHYYIATFLIIITLLFIKLLLPNINEYHYLTIGLIATISIYIFYLYMVKDEILIQTLNTIKNKIFH